MRLEVCNRVIANFRQRRNETMAGAYYDDYRITSSQPIEIATKFVVASLSGGDYEVLREAAHG